MLPRRNKSIHDRRVLVVTISTLLFFVPLCFSGQEELASSLWREGDFQAARREALRTALMDVQGDVCMHTINEKATYDAKSLRNENKASRDNTVSDVLPRRARSARDWLRMPMLGVITLYQRQISPAIGSRCSMHPSCSAFALDACRQYGLLGIPITANRLVRETDHIRYRKNPVLIGGQMKYYDPVQHHTFWFRRYRYEP